MSNDAVVDDAKASAIGNLVNINVPTVTSNVCDTFVECPNVSICSDYNWVTS